MDFAIKVVEFIADHPIIYCFMGASLLFPFFLFTYLVDKDPTADYWKEK